MSQHPAQIGPYRIRGLLGRGGMGAVYQGVHSQRGDEAAIKVLLAGGNPTQRRRLRREARALMRLRHPNVLEVLDVGEGGGEAPWIATRRVQGEPLAQCLRRGPLDIDRAVEIGVSLCGALEAAHALGLLHRDIKPDNLLLDERGQVFLVDFGLVKDVEIQESIRLSRTGEVMGTPGYWAPEQASGEGGASPATDVYGLGATLYASLTGAPPFVTGSFLECVIATREQAPEPPSRKRAEVPPWLDEVILACLAKDPADRLTLTALREALEERGFAEAGRSPAWSRAGLGVIVTALALTTVFVGALWVGEDPVPESIGSAAPSPSPSAEQPVEDPPPQEPAPTPPPSTPLADEGEEALRQGQEALQRGDPLEAKRWFRRAADAGHIPAMNELALLCMQGEGLPPDLPQAVAWFRRAADAGDPLGMTNLGTLYVNGQGVPRDTAEGLRWIRKGAEGGQVKAMAFLGFSYGEGEGVPKDLGEALRWYRKAAEAGHVVAAANLGTLYEEEESLQDFAEAARWFRRAADAGNAGAMVDLGALLGNGQGVEPDLAQAAEWFRKAADAGDPQGMRNLGALHAGGRGVPLDLPLAARLFRQAGELGDAESMSNLGLLYARGKGVPKDPAQAAGWYRRALAAGFLPAKDQLEALIRANPELAER